MQIAAAGVFSIALTEVELERFFPITFTKAELSRELSITVPVELGRALSITAWVLEANNAMPC
jgi:hypothetical protein